MHRRAQIAENNRLEVIRARILTLLDREGTCAARNVGARLSIPRNVLLPLVRRMELDGELTAMMGTDWRLMLTSARYQDRLLAQESEVWSPIDLGDF